MTKRRYLELVSQFPLLPIKAEEAYTKALEVLSHLGSSQEPIEQDYCTVLISLIQIYEKSLHLKSPQIEGPALLRSLMDEHQLNNQMLANIAGVSRQKMSDYLHNRSTLSKAARDKLGVYFSLHGGIFEYSPRTSSKIDKGTLKRTLVAETPERYGI